MKSITVQYDSPKLNRLFKWLGLVGHYNGDFSSLSGRYEGYRTGDDENLTFNFTKWNR